VRGHETELVIPRWNNLRVRSYAIASMWNTRPGRTSNWTWSRPTTGTMSTPPGHEPRAGLAALWAFACRRGAQEKTFAELKGKFELDVVLTKH
jgi:hypothetical protein